MCMGEGHHAAIVEAGDGRIDPAVTIHGPRPELEAGSSQGARRVQQGGVLVGGDRDRGFPAIECQAGRAPEGQVVGLRGAGGEHDPVRRHAHERRHAFAGVLQGA